MGRKRTESWEQKNPCPATHIHACPASSLEAPFQGCDRPHSPGPGRGAVPGLLCCNPRVECRTEGQRAFGNVDFSALTVQPHSDFCVSFLKGRFFFFFVCFLPPLNERDGELLVCVEPRLVLPCRGSVLAWRLALKRLSPTATRMWALWLHLWVTTHPAIAASWSGRRAAGVPGARAAEPGIHLAEEAREVWGPRAQSCSGSLGRPEPAPGPDDGAR